MTTRRRIGTRHVVIAASVAGVTAAVACSFPDVAFNGDGPGGGAGATTATTGVGASSSSGAASTSGHPSGSSTSGSSGSHTSTSGGTSSSSSSSSGTSTSTSSSSGNGCVDPAKPCDCDGDGDNADTPECNHDGGDCNDHDPLVNSKQTAWFTKPGSNGWDYNCSGAAEYEYTDSLTCGFFTCDTSTVKWTSTAPVPACGDMSEYGACQWVILSCNEYIQGMRPQGCH